MNRSKEFVYMIEEVLNGERTNYYRIGSTNDLDFRRMVLNQGNPRTLEKVCEAWFPSPDMVLMVERRMQKMCKPYLVLNKKGKGNSWYLINDPKVIEDVLYYVNEIKNGR
jgi:hypothetical protein